MHTLKRRMVGLLSGLAAALVMLPASAHAASPCNQSASGSSACEGQVSRESSTTVQTAEADAQAEQDATDAGLPASGATRVGGGASNSAVSGAGNEAHTTQGNEQAQSGGGSSCSSGCGGRGEAQLSFQEATTTQRAEAEAHAEQRVAAGASLAAEEDNGAERGVSNTASSGAANSAGTQQSNYQSQHGTASGCSLGCEGDGQEQLSRESSTTVQTAEADAAAEQDATDAGLPASGATRVGGGASNSAVSGAGNEAHTTQGNEQAQDGGGSSCSSGCGGRGEAQLSFQEATTTQRAEAEAHAEQRVAAGASLAAEEDNGAERGVSNTASSGAANSAGTQQSNYQSQHGTASGCSLGCEGDGQEQLSRESSTTVQTAEADAAAEQDATRIDPSGAGHGQGSSGGTGEGNAAAESSATIQLVWQIQLSECVTRCSGTEQSQAAEQQSATVQVLNGSSREDGAHGAEVAENGAHGEQGLTQIQLGCVEYCFGTTITTPAATLAAYAQALEEVMQVVREMEAGIPTPAAIPAAEQSAVEQTSYQLQVDARGVSAQDQSVSQASTTVQEYDASALIAGVQQAMELSATAKAQAISQTEQGIWQLQIGCLMFCNETQLKQLSAQSSSTVQRVAAPPAASSAAPSSANSTTQLVWQAQIGCLFWCFDTTEQQTAPGQDTPAASEGDGGSAPAEPSVSPPSEPPASSTGPIAELTYVAQLLRELLGPKAPELVAGAEPSPPAPAAAGSGSGGADFSITSSGTGTAAPATPSPALQENLVLTVSSTAGGAPGRLPTSRLHRRDARATRGFAPHRVNAQLPVIVPRADVPRPSAGVATVARVTVGAAAGDAAQDSVANATSDVSLATLLSGFALCGLCLLCIAVLAARRDPRA